MTKLLLICLFSSLGAIGFNVLHHSAQQSQTAATLARRQFVAVSNELADAQGRVAAVRTEVLGKNRRIQESTRNRKISPELLKLLEEGTGAAQAWTALRQQLGLGWESSPDYVLVNKRVLKQLVYPHLLSSARATDTACDLLAITPAEQSTIRTALNRAREGQWLRIERAEPSGDIVAQYSVPAPDPTFEQTQSNLFFTQISGSLGSERAGLLLPDAWREFKSGLAPLKGETMTIRRTTTDGEPDLICEMRREDQLATQPVRYAHYPSSWFLTLFPGGWKTLAEREGFELPDRFQR